MVHLPFRQRLVFLLIAPLLVSCNASTRATLPQSPGATPADSQGATPADSPPETTTIQRDIVYGSGPFNLPDARVGLSDLSGYQARLTVTFDGARHGQTEAWSETYWMLMQKDPAARQLTIEKSGDLTDLDPVFRAEVDGTAYERIGENPCIATQIESGNSLGDRLEPASFLSYVIGADEAGMDTVNDMAATHYTFDQRALGQQGLTEATGEMWVASEGGYIVRYLLTTNGGADHFGEGIEGALSFAYELTAVNQPVEINLPADCPPGLVDAPQLADASNIMSHAGVLTYTTASSVQDASTFYQEGLPILGWQPVGEPIIQDTSALLRFAMDGQTMLVSVTVQNDNTTVQIALLRTPE